MLFDLLKFIILNYLCALHEEHSMVVAAYGLRERLQRGPKLPSTFGPNSINVLAGMYIESLGNFRSAEMSFDMDLYLYLSWRDPSLQHNSSDYVLVNDPKVRHYIWLPDLYFANARTSRFHDVIAPNFNLFINQNGTIAYSTRITLNVACNLDLSLYPMDSQKCDISFLSYAYVEKQVRVRWFQIGGDATRYNPDIQLPEFHISNITSEYCDGTYNYAIMEFSYKRDRFSCLKAVIHLNRQIGYHMVQSYIPTGLIVMISWVSFWIDRRAVPARVTLSFTTLLSLSTLGNGLRFGLPQVAYAKAIDYWFGACLFFVFLSLLEFAAVNSYMRQAEKFERYATLCAKKNSSVFGMSTTTNTNIAKSGKETPKSTMDTSSMVPSIDGTPESVEAFKWSSAATIGNNPNGGGGGGIGMAAPAIWLSYAIPMSHTSPLRWAHYQAQHDKLVRRQNEQQQRVQQKQQKQEEHYGGRKKSVKKNEEAFVTYGEETTPTAGSGHRRVGVGANPMATNHFLREGFLYSRKGLRIDQHSRWLFPLAFAIWNIFYWGYYLWYIQKST